MDNNNILLPWILFSPTNVRFEGFWTLSLICNASPERQIQSAGHIYKYHCPLGSSECDEVIRGPGPHWAVVVWSFWTKDATSGQVVEWPLIGRGCLSWHDFLAEWMVSMMRLFIKYFNQGKKYLKTLAGLERNQDDYFYSYLLCEEWKAPHPPVHADRADGWEN